MADASDNLTSSDLCEAGLAHYNESVAHVGPARLPPLMVSLGFVAGRDGFHYRTGTGDPTRLTKDSKTKASGDVGASLVALLSERQTIEASVFYSAAWNASSTTVQWCTARGEAPRGSDAFDPADPSTFDTATSCSKATLGPPKASQTLTAEVHYGIVNRSGESWRLAMGPWLELAGSRSEARAKWQAPCRASRCRAARLHLLPPRQPSAILAESRQPSLTEAQRRAAGSVPSAG